MVRKSLFVLIPLVFVVFGPTMVFSQSKNSDIANFISSAYSSKTFSTAPVEQKDLELILQCGIRAPSARNSQPWHFTVIKDLETMKRIIPDALKGNILIIVSGYDQSDHAAAISFDCALPTENMYLAAQSLGLGSHIYTGPIANLNAKYRDSAGIPAGYMGVSILKIGNTAQPADATSSASARKADSEVVTYH